MKKSLLLFLIVFGINNALQAQESGEEFNGESGQESGLGIKIGYTNITVRAKYQGNTATVSESGFYAGLSEELMLNTKFALQPELLFARASETNFLYLPIMAKYYVFPQLSLQAGPQANLVLDNAPNEKQLGLDIAFGAEYKILPGFFIDARYGLEVTNRMADDYYDIKASYSTLMIGAGYRF